MPKRDALADAERRAMADMPRWRRKTAGSFIWYAILMGLLCIGFVAELWFLRHRVFSHFWSHPFASVVIVGGLAYAMFICASMVWLLVTTRRRMLRKSERVAGKMDQSRQA